MEHQTKMPMLPNTTQPKSNVTKPDDERRSVSLKASSSRTIKDQEDSEEEFWEERETKAGQNQKIKKQARTKSITRISEA
jgi:hypothetical protein